MIERLGLIGLTYRHGGSEALARFTLPIEQRRERLQRLAARLGVAELVYLATCNRVEVAVVGDGSTPLGEYRPRLFAALGGRQPTSGEAERTLRAWAGEGAMEHLFLVAAGLDSAQMGEREIRGQMRDALTAARRAGVAGRILTEVFDEALKVARRVHRQTGLGEGRTSLAEIAARRIRHRLAETCGPVALVGVSPMTESCGQALAREGAELLVVNRTPERAAALAAQVGGRARPLAEFQARPSRIVAAVLATGAAEPVLDRACLERLGAHGGRKPLLVDMAVPSDVDAAAAREAGFELVTMDDISREAERNRERRRRESAAARERIDEALAELRRRLAERWVSPVIAGLSRRYRETAVEGVERLLRRELAGASESEREALRRWAESLAKRFAHIPARGLRALAVAEGSEAVETFLRAADDPLARELDAAARALPERLAGEAEE